jgi:hypothetical protein
MGYSNNPELVEARRDLLAPLERGESCQWKIPGGWPETKQAAFKIREALRIAGLYPQRFPALAEAASRFAIHIVAQGLIEARLRSTPNVETAPTHVFTPQSQAIDQPLGRDIPTVGITTAEQVILSWMHRGPSNDPLRLTSVAMSQEELTQLWRWTEAHTPKLMILLNESNQTMVVSLHDMSMREYAFNPESRKKEPVKKGWQPPKPPVPKEYFDL